MVPSHGRRKRKVFVRFYMMFVFVPCMSRVFLTTILSYYVNILLELQGIVLNIFYLIIMPDASTKPYNFIARSRVGASMNQILTITKKMGDE
jgi:hypothetical protein